MRYTRDFDEFKEFEIIKGEDFQEVRREDRNHKKHKRCGDIKIKAKCVNVFLCPQKKHDK
ncbi:hypothetical protein HAHI6034_03190 [Hathewaya histolytica]|uniref:Uncharacterized protein n=1 Tax=Hathewaya histolytica TaxID=1498 RepID=A0A4U9R5E5_HATHI|nr:hypothetical protein [Hathewaya histolytica]VTQ85273.1 Uncharacterised protein [Hathewaya histolytica]